MGDERMFVQKHGFCPLRFGPVFAVLAVVCLCLGLGSQPALAGEIGKGALTASFEQGREYGDASVRIIDLHGSWHAMGRQYGHLMAKELHDVWAAKLQPFMAAHPDKAAVMEQLSDRYWRSCPYRYREVMAGMAETSGLSLQQIRMADMVERVAGITQCSALAVWGDYASGPLVYGRNYDFYPSFQTLADDVVVAVYHPADGSHAVATIGYAGEIYAVNAMNDAGLFVELNNGLPSGNGQRIKDGIHATVNLFSMMQDADSFAYLDAFFATTRCNAAYLIGAADGQTARSYEWRVDGVQRGDLTTPAGVMAMTNHFVSPQWEQPLPDDEKSWRSVTRRQNLLERAEEAKGQIDTKRMMEIMDRDLEHGGSKSDLTRYQMVVVPAEQTLWMKTTGHLEWTKIDMKDFFSVTQTRKKAA